MPVLKTHRIPMNGRVRHAMSIGAALIGSMLEYFDHFIYTYFFLAFMPLFFPTDNAYNAAMVRALAISIGFIVRPLGAFFFARLADLWGRRIVLLITSIITGFATLAIGILPTYDQVGTTASLAFIILRVVQVIAISGETTTAIFFLYEHAPPHRKAFYTGLLNVAALIAAVLASSVAILAFQITDSEHAWRIPFVLAGAASFAGYYIRNNIKESPVFETSKKEPIALWPTLIQHSENVIPHFFSGIFCLSMAYITNIYLSDYYKQIGFSDLEIMQRNIAVFSVSIFVILFGSWAGDKIGSKNIVRGAALIMFITAMPCLSLLDKPHTQEIVMYIHFYLSFVWSFVAGTVGAATIALWPARGSIQIGAIIWGFAGFFSAGGMPLVLLCSYEISSSLFLGAYLSSISSIVFFTWQRLPEFPITEAQQEGNKTHA